jgi:Double zinc ribbon
MSRFREELDVIPTVAWGIAGLAIVCTEVLLWQLAIPNDPNVRNWPFSAEVALSALAAVVPGAYVLLVGYVSGDARRRGMRQALWTLIAIFVPNCIGIILYFVMREPLMACCPKCGTPTRSTFAFCHQCGTEISQACPHCRRPVDADWKACAYCGTTLAGRVPEGMAPGGPAANPGQVG